MAVVGVICEYNPFHLGHRQQLQTIRRALGPETVIVSLMSGNYVQRGEPAIFDKFTRARAAALCGADLVLELPLTSALSSAEGFAAGGVDVLRRLGAVDTLAFGSETGNTDRLLETARLLLRPDFGPTLRECLAAGCSFAAARSRAVERLGGDAEVLARPNDILGVEYCKAILTTGAPLRPMALPRGGDERSDTAAPDGVSALAVRTRLARGEDWRELVPPEAAAVFDRAVRHDLAAGERAVLARLRFMPDSEFDALPYGSEGLSNKLRRACRTEPSIEAILAAVKSKRYAYARLKRMVLCAYLGLSAGDMSRPAPYVRVLAFGERGRPLLRQARDRGTIPLVNAGETPPDRDYWELERRAADLYTLFARGPAACRTEERGRVFVNMPTQEEV